MMPVSGDSGLGREQRGGTIERGLHCARRIAAKEFQSLDAVDLALLGNAFDLGGLLLIDRNDQLADLFVRHAMHVAEIVEHAPALHEVLRAQGTGRIIHAAMDHLAVARGDAIADASGRLRDDDLVAGQRGLTRDGKADHAGTDDENLHGIHTRRRKRWY